MQPLRAFLALLAAGTALAADVSALAGEPRSLFLLIACGAGVGWVITDLISFFAT